MSHRRRIMTPEQIAKDVLARIRAFAEEALRMAIEPVYHKWLSETVGHNVMAFRNEQLAELAGIVGAEIARREA